MYKAVIFDFDGLILDTETLHYRILQEMFEEHGSVLPLEVWVKDVGTNSGFMPFAYLEEQLKEKIDQAALQTDREKRFAQRIKEELARPGVEAYLTAARELGFKIGLASSSDYEWVSTHLKNINLFDYFECIKTSDDVEEVKPNPDLYLKAAECLGVKPEECIAFEDSVHGSTAAMRAGMACVIVPNEITAGLTFGETEHRLESMAELDFKMLLEKLEEQKRV
ncbi:HAD-IA family hydrolase [Bacillus mangrovi]|uniref:HAD-IA family hydrolase n=1 Tax=Metabacillus mangrovi TaxID=1491830 RepID=A0A7X2S4B6_9BACI|nr:HAD-IA family hydrolase [Metabacillus mangrovi]